MNKKRPAPFWRIVHAPGLESIVGGNVQAWTKGEARAILRDRILRITKLPIGLEMERVHG